MKIRRAPSKSRNPDSAMKRFALPLAALALAWAGFAPQASARPPRDGCSSSSVHVSRYARCGCPVYVRRYIAFYDEDGCPVWRKRELPVEHRCDCDHVHPREVEYREVYRIERHPQPPPIASGSITIETSW
jgi:hypothetical protein